jgi:hypothetical protein
MNLGKHFLEDAIKTFKKGKALAEKAIAQIEEKDFHWQPDNESNSIAIIMKHMSGNMISRWTDFLTTDGEKKDRNRDTEFVDDRSVEELMAFWERGWQILFNTLSGLTEDDLLKTVYIRAEPHTVVEAINRSLTHYGYHLGQLVYIAKHLRSENWKSLSIPRGKSADFLPK